MKIFSYKMISPVILFSIILFLTCTAAGQQESYITAEKSEGIFTISEAGLSSPILVSSGDFPGVIRIAGHLKKDIEAVTGAAPNLLIDSLPPAKEIIIAGTIGRSSLIDKLIADKKINVENTRGKWETFQIQVVDNPMPGIERALVVAGSDKRGTIFGIYDLSEKIGISPWYWWADVPPNKKSAVYALPGTYTMGEPKVKYRGIFINDEAPALSGWSMEKYGTDMFNHHLYEHVFELILRLKGNFLWPAMWGRAFYDDDSLNPKLADEYGVVISTSHHEPMMRAHVEWQRYGEGPWNYEKNAETLREFWREGIKRMGDNESVVTLAMRGDGDEAMSPDANVSLLEGIVKDQREIIKEVTGKDVESVPQVWALYKEVQEYYDKGMRVPDDVTVLLCDDNWGNIRKLPKLNEKPRKGGYGIYYHFDYVGGPRNYKWINTNQIEKVWEQMHLAYEYNARQIWIVNVGDIKPVEFPIEFFLDYAWNPEAITSDQLPEYYRTWASEQFPAAGIGADYSAEIAQIMAAYTKFNSRRKPEMLAPGTYSLTNYREAERIVEEYKALEEKTRLIYDKLPARYRDAFYQLVMHPVEASANLNELYLAAGKNYLYSEQGRASANFYAEKVSELFKRDAEISLYYNDSLADSKWKHMMDQTHIGYTSWQQPDQNVMPEVTEVDLNNNSEMGVAVEGSEKWWPRETGNAVLPLFDPYNDPSYYIEIFNRGKNSFDYSVKTEVPWIRLSKVNGKISSEERIFVSIDWEKAPEGKHKLPLKIKGAGEEVSVFAEIFNPLSPEPENIEGFIDGNGYVSIEAEHYSGKVEDNGIKWQIIPNLGRTLSAVTTLPVTAASQVPGKNSSALEYKVYLFDTGSVKVNVYLSPTLNFKSTEGLRYAVSFDDQEPQVINFQSGDTIPDWKYPRWWNEAVGNNIRVSGSIHNINEPGDHILKFRMVDPGVVLQKIVIETGEVKPSYLGPPESYHRNVNDAKAELK